MKKYEVLLFDLHDTLIDNKENMKHAFKALLNAMNEEYTEEKNNRFNQIDHRFWNDWKNELIIIPDEYKAPREKMVRWATAQRFLIYFENTISLEEAYRLNEIYIKALVAQVVPLKAACEIIKYLNKKYRLFIATNGPLEIARIKIKMLGIDDCFENVFAAEEFGYLKPHQEYYNQLTDRINYFDITKILMIGNSLASDIIGANRIGMDSIWLDLGEENVGKIKDETPSPTYTIKKLIELKKIL